MPQVCTTPHLGLATTKELIDELAARARVADIVGDTWQDYRTVSEEEMKMVELDTKTSQFLIRQKGLCGELLPNGRICIRGDVHEHGGELNE